MSDQISVNETARLLRVSTRTVYNMLRDGDLEATRFRGRWVVSRTAVVRHLKNLGLEVTG